MFNQYTYLTDSAHVYALEAALRKAAAKSLTDVSAALLATLYKQALEAVTGEPDKKTGGNFVSRILSTTHVIGTATCYRTGMYIQLARETAGSPTKIYMTVGQKWSVEGRDSLGATSTLNWT